MKLISFGIKLAKSTTGGMMTTTIDLWAEENAPIVNEVATVYSLRIPRDLTRRTSDSANVYVEVDQYGMMNIHTGTYWFRRDWKQDYSIQREIMDWLVEWEYAEWRQIGPEDSELFATEKLTNAK
jgi:hypothetical protein